MNQSFCIAVDMYGSTNPIILKKSIYIYRSSLGVAALEANMLPIVNNNKIKEKTLIFGKYYDQNIKPK